MATIREFINELEERAKEYGDDVQVYAPDGIRLFPASYDLPGWERIQLEGKA